MVASDMLIGRTTTQLFLHNRSPKAAPPNPQSAPLEPHITQNRIDFARSPTTLGGFEMGCSHPVIFRCEPSLKFISLVK